MPTTDPVLCKRIPTAPWGDPKDRKTVTYDQYVKTGGYEALEKALSMTPAEIVDLVKESQLRGRGGAGFPCGLKWTFLPEPDGGRRYLAMNCDEAEPGTFKDRYYLERRPHMFLEGMLIAAWGVEAERCYIYMRDEYPAVLEILRREIAALEEAGIAEPGYIELRRGAVRPRAALRDGSVQVFVQHQRVTVRDLLALLSHHPLALLVDEIIHSVGVRHSRERGLMDRAGAALAGVAVEVFEFASALGLPGNVRARRGLLTELSRR